ncbi:acyl-CoA N-acyltransferase [Karstenula rhodostoma CBS 690.94]|uniref:Acyl-CoA N-acyltransferase n=1 Tax=Karstenula rhodostoma CBS 690.94 TaxID=1392251 RepID=A0A9P4PP57_9PLEO|nr:acyl-CoA N-acyltransferase [Karstenula rhodostoma CBS 690.94]
MTNPQLQVSLLRPEEAEQFMRIRHKVFKPTINKILYSRGEPSQKILDRVTKDVRDGIVNKGMLYLKCVDVATGEMIAGARWRYAKPKEEGARERTWDEVEAGFTVPEPYEESDPELFRSLFHLLNTNKREILGNRPYYTLITCAVLPQHERRGAGTMLVQWGCDRADEAGVEAYIEASLMGVPVYERLGFKPVKRIELNTKDFGAKENEAFIVMIRPAKAERMDLPTAV